MTPGDFTLDLVSADSPQYIDFVPALTAAYHALSTSPPPTALVVNVSACRFLTPGHLVVLACLVEAYYQKGIVVSLGVSDNEVHEYLEGIRGSRSLTVPASPAKTSTPRFACGRYIPR